MHLTTNYTVLRYFSIQKTFFFLLLIFSLSLFSPISLYAQDGSGGEEEVIEEDPEKHSIRFYGHQEDGLDRVTIPLNTPADVGQDFTIEWWMKAEASDNTGTCGVGGAGWVFGNVIFERDRQEDQLIDPDGGSYGVSITDGRVAFATYNGIWGESLCGNIPVADGRWHHVAVTRNWTNGQMVIYVDGVLDVSVFGPTGDIGYEGDGGLLYVGGQQAREDITPQEFLSYNGFVDDLRISTNVRYAGTFQVSQFEFEPDEFTAALYDFNSGEGGIVEDLTENAVTATIVPGGVNNGPSWEIADPFDDGDALRVHLNYPPPSPGGSGGGGGGGGGGSENVNVIGVISPFSDVPTSQTFYEFIKKLYDAGVVGGFSDGTFRPDASVTRGQMSKFIVNGFGIPIDTSCADFPDVNPGDTFYDFATTLKCRGVVSGYSDGRFGPDDNVTRGQAMKFVVEGSRASTGNPGFLPVTQNNVFPDVANGSTFYEYIMAAYSGGIVNGYPNGTFGPDDSVNRGAMSKMVSNTRDQL